MIDLQLSYAFASAIFVDRFHQQKFEQASVLVFAEALTIRLGRPSVEQARLLTSPLRARSRMAGCSPGRTSPLNGRARWRATIADNAGNNRGVELRFSRDQINRSSAPLWEPSRAVWTHMTAHDGALILEVAITFNGRRQIPGQYWINVRKTATDDRFTCTISSGILFVLLPEKPLDLGSGLLFQV